MTEIKIKIQIKHIIALSSANSPADLMNIKLTNKTHASRTNAKAHKTEIKDEELFDLAILAKIREVCKSMTYSSQFGCARQLSSASCGSRGISTSLTEEEVCTPPYQNHIYVTYSAYIYM